MKISRKVFSDAFTAVSAVVPSKTTKPVLMNVRMIADGTNIALSASDTEIHMQVDVPYIGEPEQILIPSSRMLAILREASGDELTLTVTDKKLRIKCGSANYNLGLEDAEEFPDIPIFNADAYFTVAATPLRDGIKRTSFSVDEKTTRYALGGIQVEFEGETLSLASTDSRRLSLAKAAASKVNNPEWPIVNPVVPVAAMRIIAGVLNTEPCWIASANNNVVFKIGNVSITSQTVQGRLPDYRKVLVKPEESKRTVMIPVNQFSALVRQVRVLETPESTGLTFIFGGGKLIIESKDQDIGKAQSDMPIPDDGEPLTIIFGGSYVADLLKNLDQGSSVEVKLIDGDNRAMFISGDYQHLIMPFAQE